MKSAELFIRKNRSKINLFDIGIFIALFIVVIFTLYPFWYIFIYSLSDPTLAAKGYVTFLPAGFTLENYAIIMAQGNILHAAFISVSRTVISAVVGTFSCALFAYALTKETLPFRKTIYRIVLFTMYLSPGLIPWYILMKDLHLKNNFLLYILPGIIQAFYLILIKTYIESLPSALEESAFVDGANYFTIFIKIILPLSTPVLAAVAIFTAVGAWNTWQDNMFLCTDKNLETLQLLLYNFLSSQEANLLTIKQKIMTGTIGAMVTPTSLRMTITMIVTLPIIFVYPIMQRYFVKGILLGAVKG